MVATLYEFLFYTLKSNLQASSKSLNNHGFLLGLPGLKNVSVKCEFRYILALRFQSIVGLYQFCVLTVTMGG